jgi:uridine kinase
MTELPRSRPASSYQERADSLLALLRSDFGFPRATRSVIAVAGESGSGKSVTAIDLVTVMTAAGIKSEIIHQDNYFIRPPRTNHEHRLQDLTSVGPHEVQLDLIREHMRAFRAGDAVDSPVVDYPGNRFVSQRLDFAQTAVLVVEGTFALLIGGQDIGVFLRATWQDTAGRRKARNRDIDDPIIDTILGIEHDIIAPQADLADILLDRDFEISKRL